MAIRWLLALLLLTQPAAAHDWYPWDCCSGYDCAPAQSAAVSDDASLLVTSKHGTVAVPASLQRRESKDGRMHVCMRPDPTGQMRPICLFVPPAM